MTNESSFSDFTIELSSFIEFSCQTCFQIRFLTSDIVDSILFCFTRQRFNFMLSFQSNSKHDRSNIESLDCDVFIDRSHWFNFLLYQDNDSIIDNRQFLLFSVRNSTSCLLLNYLSIINIRILRTRLSRFFDTRRDYAAINERLDQRFEWTRFRKRHNMRWSHDFYVNNVLKQDNSNLSYKLNQLWL
jgi:hypothetical protein